MDTTTQQRISEQLTKIAITLASTEASVNRLAEDSEELEQRIVSIEKQIEVSSNSMRGFWERDWGNMMSEIKSINEKLQSQMSFGNQRQSETALLEQKVALTFRVYDEKIAKLEKTSEENQVALWKLLGVGGSSGAVIAGLITLAQHLLANGAGP